VHPDSTALELSKNKRNSYAGSAKIEGAQTNNWRDRTNDESNSVILGIMLNNANRLMLARAVARKFNTTGFKRQILMHLE
jgi:hypothetical protein